MLRAAPVVYRRAEHDEHPARDDGAPAGRPAGAARRRRRRRARPPSGSAGRRVLLAGTGTSWHAAGHGAALLRLARRRGVAARGARPRARGAGARSARDALILLSHTGAKRYSAQRARRRARRPGCPTVAIGGIGAPGVDLETVELERSDTYTASHLGALLRLAQLAEALGATLGASSRACPSAVERRARRPRASRSRRRRALLEFIGGGTNAWTAAEGALKAREASYVATEGLGVEQYVHGPSVAVGAQDALVVLDGGGPWSARLDEAAAARPPTPGAVVHRIREHALGEPLSIFPLTAARAADRARARPRRSAPTRTRSARSFRATSAGRRSSTSPRSARGVRLTCGATRRPARRDLPARPPTGPHAAGPRGARRGRHRDRVRARRRARRRQPRRARSGAPADDRRAARRPSARCASAGPASRRAARSPSTTGRRARRCDRSGGAVSRSVAFRSLHLRGGLVQIAAVDSLARVVRLTSGRLPRTCTPARCEVVALSGHPLARMDAIGIHIRVVGRGLLTSQLALGDVLVREPGQPAVPVVATSSVAQLTSLPALSSLFRGYSWAVRAAAAVAARVEHLGRDGPGRRRRDRPAEPRPGVRRRRAGAGGDRGPGQRHALPRAGSCSSAARRPRSCSRSPCSQPRACDGTSRPSAAASSSTARRAASRRCSPSRSRASRPSSAPSRGIVDRRRRRSRRSPIAPGCPAGELTRHALGSTARDRARRRLRARRRRARRGPAADRRGRRAAPRSHRSARHGRDRERPRGRARPAARSGDRRRAAARIRAPVRCCWCCPALVALATGVALARLIGPVTRLAERAGRGASAAPRLALLALARGRGRTSATAAFLAVSTGLAVFAAVYGATLSEGDRQQAAFRVPLDYTASQGTSLTRPLGAASLADWRRARAGRRRAAGAAALVGRPAARRLARLARPDRRSGRRAAEAALDRSCRPRAVCGRHRAEARAGRRASALRGLRLPAGARDVSLAATASGELTDLTMTVATPPRRHRPRRPATRPGRATAGACPRARSAGS